MRLSKPRLAVNQILMHEYSPRNEASSIFSQPNDLGASCATLWFASLKNFMNLIARILFIRYSKHYTILPKAET